MEQIKKKRKRKKRKKETEKIRRKELHSWGPLTYNDK